VLLAHLNRRNPQNVLANVYVTLWYFKFKMDLDID